jgi:hypothetical protein
MFPKLQVMPNELALRNQTVQTLTFCTCYSLSKEHLVVALGNFPVARKLVHLWGF